MTTSDFLRVLENALEIEERKLVGSESLADAEWWDSMSALTFMAVADQELHVTVSGVQLQNCKTINDLLGLLGDKVTL